MYDLRKTVRATYDTSGARTASYLAGSGFGEVLAMIDAGGVESYGLRDRLGTTVGWVDGGGGLSFTVRDAYGVRGIAPAGVVPFGYTGHAEDPTGLVWGRARCMAPTTGAWTSEDPVSTESRYGYVGGRPGFLLDPTGRAEAVEVGFMTILGCGVSGGLVGSFMRFFGRSDIPALVGAAACGATGSPAGAVTAWAIVWTLESAVTGDHYGEGGGSDTGDTGHGFP